MTHILIKPFTYISLIVIGFTLKKTKTMQAQDAGSLGLLSVNLLLPMAIASSFRGFNFEFNLLFIAVGSFLLNVILALVGKLLAPKEDVQWQAVFLLNNASQNIGSLALPFLITLYDPKYLIYMSMFDMGNALYSTGINLAMAKSTLHESSQYTIKDFFQTLTHSAPFMMYITMLSIVGFGFALPDVFFDVATMLGNANVVIVMVMFGLLLDFNSSKEVYFNSLRVLVVRYASAFVVALLIWVLLPIPMQAKQVLVICVFTPMSSVIATYCLKLGIDREKYALINTLSMPISILIITVLTLIWV